LKKSLSALVAIAAIYAPLSALASDGTINFSGALTATTCTVTNGGATALNVSLPTLATTAPNPTAGDTSFALTVSGCTGPTTTATTYFEAGPTINTASGRLLNTAAGGPANIELELLNGNSTTINLAGTTGTQGVSAAAVSSGSATANFIVRYFHTDTNAVAAGSVTSAVTYSMVYN
jgi:major type 1 subunit fimbrin (pilin)